MEFRGAPVSRVLFVVLAAVNLFYLGSYQTTSSLLTFSRLTASPFPTLLTYHFAFADRGSALFSSILLYQQVRSLEKILGSRKFLSFVLLTGLAGALWSLLLLSILPTLALASGPFLLLFSTLALYTKYIPTCEPYLASVLSIPITDKTFSYILALQVSLSCGWSSFLPSLLGYIAGLAYASAPFSPYLDSLLVGHSVSSALSSLDAAFSGAPGDPADLLGLQHLSLEYAVAPSSTTTTARGAADLQARRRPPPPPGGVVDFNRPLIDPAAFGGLGAGGFADVMPPRPPPAASRQGGPTSSSSSSAASSSSSSSAAGAAPPRDEFEDIVVLPPSEEAIKSLMDMGFGREPAITALRQADNNVEYALNRLLGA